MTTTDRAEPVFANVRSGPEVPTPNRGIYCNRTLNLRSIRAIGYDLDYTLVHYRVKEWEHRAYAYVRNKLVDQGWPVRNLTFDPTLAVRGLIIDTELGNIVKANRFGYVKQAVHGTTPLDFEVQRKLYGRTIIELGEGRFEFLNTLFSISEACLYSQLVDLLDSRELPEVLNYDDLYRIVRSALDETHVEGLLKAEIIANPARFVELDPDLPLTLLDQKHAGKKLVLITNSEWSYARAVMEYAFDRFLPERTWRDLFDVVIVSARKPSFFVSPSPLFRVVNDEGLLQHTEKGITDRGVYFGGSANAVEQYLGVSGDQILYVGDHMFADVKVSKNVLRWRTALILREMEKEITAVTAFQSKQAQLTKLMQEKSVLELQQSQVRLALQRRRLGYGPQPESEVNELEATLTQLRERISAIDDRVSGLAVAAGELASSRWGPLMRAGNDKSHLARQIERYADIYTSRVSNFLLYAPFYYFRSSRGSLPHDQ